MNSNTNFYQFVCTDLSLRIVLEVPRVSLSELPIAERSRWPNGFEIPWSRLRSGVFHGQVHLPSQRTKALSNHQAESGLTMRVVGSRVITVEVIPRITMGWMLGAVINRWSSAAKPGIEITWADYTQYQLFSRVNHQLSMVIVDARLVTWVPKETFWSTDRKSVV